MTIATAKNTPRNTYTATGGQTVFTIGFEFFATGDIKVFRNGTALTFNAAPSSVAQFSVQGTTNASDSAYEFGAGGTVTLGAGATADDSIVIVRDIVVERTTDFTPAASFDVTALNTQLDTLMAMMAEREEGNSRSIRLPLSETTTVFDMELPVQATRANKVLEFDSNGDPQCLVTSTNIATLGNLTSELSTLAAISSNITTVAGISANVTTVAGKAAEITSVAAKASLITSDFVSDLNTLAVTDVVNDINTLATSDIVSDLNTLATSDIVSDLNTLATSDIISDINTLATSDIVSDLNTLATSDIVTDLNLLATSANVTNMATLGASGVVTNIGTVAGISSDVATVAGISSAVSAVNSNATNINAVNSNSSNINTVAGNNTNINTVAGNNTNINTVAGANSNISTVAGISANVTSVADVSANVTSVAGIASNVTTVAGVASNVTTVATNISGVNSFAERYRVTSGDPGSSNDTGDLNYDTSANALKYYNGSAWVAIVAADPVNSTTVTAAGALMDSECTSLADVKALNQSLTSSASPTFATLNATTVDLGNWTITESSGVLYFATSGTNKMKLDASGNLTVVGDITAFGSM